MPDNSKALFDLCDTPHSRSSHLHPSRRLRSHYFSKPPYRLIIQYQISNFTPTFLAVASKHNEKPSTAMSSTLNAYAPEHTLRPKLDGEIVRHDACCHCAGKTEPFPDEGIILGAEGSIAVKPDLAVDIFKGTEVYVTKDSAGDWISCWDVHFDGGLWNAVLELSGCCEGSVRRCEVARQGRRPGNMIGW